MRTGVSAWWAYSAPLGAGGHQGGSILVPPIGLSHLQFLERF